jgi:DNA-nicking Smr family endonuclease
MAKDREDRALSKPADKRAANQTLSEEERALWEHAARNLKPLRGKARVHRAHEEPGDPVTPRAAPTEKPRLRDSPLRAGPQPGMPAPGASTPPQLSDLDRRKARRIGTGKIDIEARIDLHGMRQSEAHAALRRFLRQAHAVGRRWVLIITGKGGPLQLRSRAGVRPLARRGGPRCAQAQRAALARRARAQVDRRGIYGGRRPSRRRRRALCTAAQKGPFRRRVSYGQVATIFSSACVRPESA